jgi:hypothetical protein
VLNEVRRQFTPEFINRIHEMVVFHPLGERQYRVDRCGSTRSYSSNAWPRERMAMTVSDEALREIAKVGFDRGSTVQGPSNGRFSSILRIQSRVWCLRGVTDPKTSFRLIFETVSLFLNAFVH